MFLNFCLLWKRKTQVITPELYQPHVLYTLRKKENYCSGTDVKKLERKKLNAYIIHFKRRRDSKKNLKYQTVLYTIIQNIVPWFSHMHVYKRGVLLGGIHICMYIYPFKSLPKLFFLQLALMKKKIMKGKKSLTRREKIRRGKIFNGYNHRGCCFNPSSFLFSAKKRLGWFFVSFLVCF